MQFLMGLNDAFDHSKDQILLMDPLPIVQRVPAMILKVEMTDFSRVQGMNKGYSLNKGTFRTVEDTYPYKGS